MALFKDQNPVKTRVLTFFNNVKDAEFWKEKFSFLKNWKSPFYFVLFTIVVGFLWCIFGLATNNFSSAFNWDYSHQYLPFAQSYHDTWRHFFTTGEFILYDNVTFIGSDNIGANAYYGLFDPFMILISFFPRSAVPQMFALATIAKLTLSVVFSRMFLKYRGISEGAARFGAIAIGFSGYLNFMVGFPTFVSALTYVPLVLYGIERVLKEKKVGALSIGIFLMMVSCFLLLVTMCIWGVIYAVFRYFVTFKERKAKDNVLVILIGILGFAIGLMLCMWVLLPSLRLSSMTGRTASIGAAYKDGLIEAIKNKDFRTFFQLIFLEVGESPARELMGLVSFFYPTGGFIALPLVRANSSNAYDAWTAAIFCYTPFVILFFQGLLHSIAQRKISHIFGILGCLFFAFTTFGYYFFFGFSGNGYGRWLFVLVPSIVHYGCWAYDQRKDSNRWIPLAGSVLAVIMTILAYCIIFWMLESRRFDWVNYSTYYKSEYLVPTDEFSGLIRSYYLYYQIALIVFESVILLVGYKKKWLSHVMLIFVAAEAIAMGNTAYFYVGLWNTKTYYMNGEQSLNSALYVASKIDARGEPFYRVDTDHAHTTDNFQYAFGEAGSGSFHSLINYDDIEFCYMNYMLGTPIVNSKKAYNDTAITDYGWSGYYRDRRYGTDYALGYRYIVRRNLPSGSDVWNGESVPFGAVEIPEYSQNRTDYRVYRVDEQHMPYLGHAVDSSLLFRMNRNEAGTASDFYGSSFRSNVNTIHSNHVRNGEIFMRGAIIDDKVELPEVFEIKNTKGITAAALNEEFGRRVLSNGSGLKFENYKPKSGDYLYASKNALYYNEGLGYIVNHYDTKAQITSATSTVAGKDHILISPTSGTYFNDEEEGAYFLITKRTNETQRNLDKKNFLKQPRVIFYGASGEVLGYDGSAFGTLGEGGKFENWQLGYAGSSGFFARGKVAYICLIWPYLDSADTKNAQRLDPNDYRITCIGANEMNAITNKAYEDRLQDVKKVKNGYTFHTNYDSMRVISTQLGYDLGWNVTAIDESGNRTKLQSIRVDGGLQGFVAPAGKVSYEMIYFTPELNKGIVLAVAGIGLYGGYVILSFILDTKRIKKEMSLKGASPK